MRKGANRYSSSFSKNRTISQTATQSGFKPSHTRSDNKLTQASPAATHQRSTTGQGRYSSKLGWHRKREQARTPKNYFMKQLQSRVLRDDVNMPFRPTSTTHKAERFINRARRVHTSCYVEIPNQNIRTQYQQPSAYPIGIMRVKTEGQEELSHAKTPKKQSRPRLVLPEPAHPTSAQHFLTALSFAAESSIDKSTIQKSEEQVEGDESVRGGRSILSSSMDSHRVNDEASYEKEVEHLTKQFLQEWSKMKGSRGELYKGLRQQYMAIRKDKRVVVSPTDKDGRHSMVGSGKLKSSNVESSMAHNLTTTQLREHEQKVEMIKQEILLRQIFEQAYFYSRGRRKQLCNSLPDGDDPPPAAPTLRSKLTFMNYMRHRKVKKRMIERKTPKSSHLHRNQQLLSSLQMSHPQHQQVLSDCIEQALHAASAQPPPVQPQSEQA